MFAIDPAIEKKISGTSSTNSRLSQIWPIGYSTCALSPSVRPMIAPMMTNAINMIGSRYDDLFFVSVCIFSFLRPIL